MGIIQPLGYGASQADWDSWMLALAKWTANQDKISAGLPVTKQGIDNLMQMAGSTSNAFLMYYVTSLPAVPSYSNQVVYNGQDGRIYAWDNTAGAWKATGATAFDQLTGLLQAGQLLLGNQLDLCTNGCFTNDTVGGPPNGWTTNSSFSGAPVIVQSASSSPAGCPTANCIFIQGRDTNFIAGNGFDVKPNDVYYLEAFMASDGSTPGMAVGLYFPAVGSNGPTWLGAAGAPSGQNGWISNNGTVVVPSWANRAQVWLQVNAMSGTPSAYGNNWFTGIECVKAPSTLQNFSTSGAFIPVDNADHIIYSGSFVSGYATIIHASLNSYTLTSPFNGYCFMSVDGTSVDTKEIYVTGPSQAGCPADLYAVVSSPGSHTFDISFHNTSSGGEIVTRISSGYILNLLK